MIRILTNSNLEAHAAAVVPLFTPTAAPRAQRATVTVTVWGDSYWDIGAQFWRLPSDKLLPAVQERLPQVTALHRLTLDCDALLCTAFDGHGAVQWTANGDDALAIWLACRRIREKRM